MNTPASKPRMTVPIILIAVAIIVIAVVGYRTFAPYEEMIAEQEQSARTVLALLPIKNLGGEEYDAPTDRLTRVLHSRVAVIPKLVMVDHTRVKPYAKTDKSPAEIGNELNAGYLLRTTVQWSEPGALADSIYLNISLVSTDSGEELWIGAYGDQAAGLYAMQEDIVANLVRTLGL